MNLTESSKHDSKRFLAIIPARAGSKRLPDKNIKSLCGKPLLAWSIKSALDSKYIDEVVVSTDSSVYAEIAKDYGANVPFLRPECLASDTTTTFDVLEHCIRFYEQNLQKEFDYIVLLQPTSPLREAWHINESCQKLLDSNANSLISVCKCEHSPLWSNTLAEDESMDNFLSPKVLNVRSQDLPAYYRLNGVIFIAKTKALLQAKSFFMPHSIAYKMDTMYSSDIDTPLDFEIASVIKNHISANVHLRDLTTSVTGGGQN
ncbi:acylneuraminate cytidylyltransferase family protein [Helicobacter jaachi]|uniref:Acylneuraminate cytidylyltransferase family protein n=1 Tax=Helicobacter jaachi TaxID=1677920 RepID=A0A4U8TD90_9HELI|nr:acylneuraminate cytidylyltransferase family protein [Helicobacter jaachi]